MAEQVIPPAELEVLVAEAAQAGGIGVRDPTGLAAQAERGAMLVLEAVVVEDPRQPLPLQVELAVMVAMVMPTSTSFLLSLLMLVCLAVKVLVEAVAGRLGIMSVEHSELEAPKLLVSLPSNPEWVMVLEEKVVMVLTV